jgi:hypothetical protein
MQEPLFWLQCSLNDPKEEPVMKSMQKFVAALLGTALCAVLLATAAFAQGGVAVTLPVSIRTAGADPEPNAAYTLCLQAVDNAPMPDGAQNGQYSVTVQGAGNYTFTSILQPDDVDAVQNSGYPLVLYSCTYSGKTRLTVFCKKV